MTGSKSLAVMFLFGALLVGGALGFTADRMLTPDRRCDSRGMRKNMADELQLTAAQRASFDAILDAKHREMSAIMSTVRPRMDAVSDSARRQIAAILDERQRARFEKLRLEMKERRKGPGDRK